MELSIGKQDKGNLNTMYIAPYDSLLSTLGMSKTDLKDNNTVAIPARLFKLLIKAVAASGDFDENSYFSEILTFSGQSQIRSASGPRIARLIELVATSMQPRASRLAPEYEDDASQRHTCFNQ